MKWCAGIFTPLAALMLCSCGAGRSAYSPDGPPTVSMPAKLSDRERSYIYEIDSSLRREGLIPVRKGDGDLELDFVISEWPIHTNTRIILKDKSKHIATGYGRAAGLPMIGRNSVADKSFSTAYAEFQASLSQTSSGRGWSSGSSLTGPDLGMPDSLPVY